MMQNCKRYFYFEIVTRKLFSKKRAIFTWLMNLEKAFDRVPRDVAWFECLIKFVQSMFRNYQSLVTVSGTFIADFLVQVELHESSVLIRLLFSIVVRVLDKLG